ncbi:MAG: hypothetical protein CL666_04970 [Balneola sp.]|nr:hypothetical protein [Balneola sp.]|tara:strand:- start:51825 stop:52589 length:765 start_codon:yes stop_codon:yes gene_type:complete
MSDIMKLYKLFLISFLALFLTVHANAQNTGNETDYQTVQITNKAGTTIYAEDKTEVKGSPLLKESFENGRILFESGKASEILPINYDSYKNQVLFIKDQKIMVLNTNGVKGFMFETPADFQNTDKVQEVFSYQIRETELGFDELTPVQVLYNQGTGLKLLAVHRTNLMRSNSKDPFTGKKTERYINSEEFFIQKHNGDIEELRRLRAKDIIRKYDRSDRKALNNFMDENDLDSRSEKDLVKLMTYIDNTLGSDS